MKATWISGIVLLVASASAGAADDKKADPREELTKSRSSADIRAQDYGIHEETDHILEALDSAIGDRRSHDQIIESAPLGERNLESAEKRTE